MKHTTFFEHMEYLFEEITFPQYKFICISSLSGDDEQQVFPD